MHRRLRTASRARLVARRGSHVAQEDHVKRLHARKVVHEAPIDQRVTLITSGKLTRSSAESRAGWRRDVVCVGLSHSPGGAHAKYMRFCPRAHARTSRTRLPMRDILGELVPLPHAAERLVLVSSWRGSSKKLLVVH